MLVYEIIRLFLEQFIINAANFIWGTPLLILLMGGSIFFTIYSRALPFRYFKHAIDIIRGKYDEEGEQGEISHFEALSGHLAATVGMGNISGVAIAIATGGPGAIFWMWISAIFGITTKFFTCTLALMYRGKDSEGNIQGGPMYVIREGMGKKWIPLAKLFCVAGFLGSTPIFQANQIVQVTKNVILAPSQISLGSDFQTNFILGLIITVVTALVIFGGIKRIASVAGKLVPLMVILYGISVLYIIAVYHTEIIPNFILIFTDAFTAQAVLGGAVGAIIIAGVRRAAFSNEAGIGTAPMMHGAATTNEPVREGLVAMIGPVTDTLVVCTLTGLAILITGVWKIPDQNGIILTVKAFELAMPGFGPYILIICVLIFALTTVFGVSYYGKKCLSFLIGTQYGNYFNYWFIILIVVGSVSSLTVVVSFIDFMYAVMAFPTIISAVYLAPKVMKEAKRYFSSLD